MDWTDIIDKIGGDIIAEIDFRVDMMVLGGYHGYMANPTIDYVERLTGKQIKALWRWWTRTIVSRVYGGRINYSLIEKDKLSKLGLGGGENQDPSSYSIVIEAKDDYSIKNVLHSSDLRRIPVSHLPNTIRFMNKVRLKMGNKIRADKTSTRYAITIQGINRNEMRELILSGLGSVLDEMKFKLYLLRNGGGGDDDFSLSSLFLSLILGSVGWASNRGFGSLTPIKIDVKSYNVSEEIKNICSYLTNPPRNDEFKNKIYDLIEKNIEYVSRILNKPVAAIRNIPKVPTIGRRNENFFRLDIYNGFSDAWSTLEKIGECCLKATWKKLNGKGIRYPGGRWHTWILGLPRKASIGGNVTGYIGVDRRQSSILMKMLRYNNKISVLVVGILSEDWNIGEIKHCSVSRRRGRRCIPISNISGGSNLTQVFNEAWKKIGKCFRVGS